MNFCQLFNLPPLPASPDTLVSFVAYQTIVLRNSVTTTLNALSAIRREHLNAGHDLPTPTTFFPLSEAVRGARRFLSRPTIQKSPIYPSLLAALIGLTDWASPMRCLYLTLWYTFARLASLIPTNSSFDVNSHLSWSNIVFHSDYVEIVVPKTKTIQCNERKLRFFIPKHQNLSVCLYTQLRSLYLSSLFRNPTDPVFVVQHLGCWKPLSRQTANPTFKAALTAIGVNSSAYGWSSFRRARATSCFIATGDVEALREHGD